MCQGQDALRGADLLWHRVPPILWGPLPPRPGSPSPRVPRSQGQQHRNGTHIYALIKLGREKVPKGLDQDPAVDSSYHGEDWPAHSICYPQPRGHGGGCPPSPAEQGRAAPPEVLLLVMASGEKGCGRP